MRRQSPSAPWRETLLRALLGGSDRPPLWLRWGRPFVAAVGIIAPIVCFAYGEQIQSWRLRCKLDNAVTKARRLDAQGEREQALACLIKEVNSSSQAHHPESLRTLAELAAETYPREALDLYHRIEAMTDLAVEDRAEMALLMIRVGQRSEGLSLLDQLAATSPDDLRLQSLRGEVSSTAAALLGGLQRSPPLKSAPPAIAMHLDLAAQTASSGDEARNAVARVIAKHPPRSDAERLIYVRWLLTHACPHLAIPLISDTDALRDNALLALKLDALMNAAQWDTASALASRATVAIAPAVRWLLRGLVAARQPDAPQDLASVYLERALQLATHDRQPSIIAAIAAIAQDHRDDSLAMTALEDQFQLGFTTSDSVDRYLLSARRTGLTANVTLTRLSALRHFTDLGNEIRITLTYLKLLCGDDLEMNLATIARLRTRMPDLPRLKLVAALAHQRFGDLEQARSLLLSLPTCPWQTGEVAVMAGILADAGRSDHFDRIVPHMAFTSLFPEEASFLNRWRAAHHLEAVTVTEPAEEIRRAQPADLLSHTEAWGWAPSPRTTVK